MTWLSITWFGLLALGMPVAFTLGVAALLYMWWADMPLVVLPQRMAVCGRNCAKLERRLVTSTK